MKAIWIVLQLQHFHLGSQVPDIIDVRRSAAEACRFFVELRKEGAPLNYIDLGGGLGIDYTGEHKSTENSINYSTDEYCYSIVEAVKNTMDDADQKHPHNRHRKRKGNGRLQLHVAVQHHQCDPLRRR